MAAAYTLKLSPNSILPHSPNSKKPSSSSLPLLQFLPNTSFLGFPTLISSLSPKRTSRARTASAAVVFMLPTAKPGAPADKTADKITRWSADAIKSFGMGKLEARKLKYPTTGTEALLMGILVEGEAAQFLRANGIKLFKVREETVKLLGKSEMYFLSPEHPPLTEPAQRALDWAVDENMKSGEGGEVTTSHMLLGIWSEKNSGGHKILATLGFDDQKAGELAKIAGKHAVMCRS